MNIDNCNYSIEKKNATRQLYKYAISSVCAMWVFSIYTMVDGIFVARGVGVIPLAAVNISMPIINLSFGLSILMSVGASTRASYWKGMGKKHEADKTFTEGCIWVLILALITSISSYIFIEPLGRLLGADGQTMPYVKSYLSILLLFDCCYMVSYYLEVLVKADGYPQKAILYPLVGAVVNIGLDYVFIFRLHMGISGAAWATGLAQLTSLLLFMHHYMRKSHKGFSFTPVVLRPDLALEMGAIGFADAITEVSVGVVIMIFNRRLLEIYGNDAIAIYTIISYLSQLVLMTVVGLSQGMQPLLSYYWGRCGALTSGENQAEEQKAALNQAEEQKAAINKADKLGNDMEYRRESEEILTLVFIKSLIIGIILSIGAFSICQIGAKWIVRIFLNEGEHHLLEVAVSSLRMYSYSYLPLGVTIIIYASLVAFEKSGPAMSISISRGIALSVVLVYVLPVFLGLEGVWLSQILAEWATMILAVILYRTKLKNQLGKSEVNMLKGTK